VVQSAVVNKLQRENLQFSTLANLAIVRGDSDLSLKAQLAKYEQSVQNIYSGIDWNPFPTDFWIGNSDSVEVIK
jgi:hypothetical protein